MNKKKCSKCEQELKSTLNKEYTSNLRMALEYCKDHDSQYIGHKSKPVWCRECSQLIKYIITEIKFREIR